ncbi:MAG: glycosyltransferase [Alphaproteobacteria bacterium]|nr:glycosyltransferase [Alphaproteobacteria bacterium]
MKHTVLIVIGDLDIGGAERHLVQILPRLNREHFRVVVYTLTHKGALAETLEAKGISVIEPGLGSKVRRILPRFGRLWVLTPLTMIPLIFLMRKLRPDIIHFFLPRPYLVGTICALIAGSRYRVMSRRSLSVYQKHHPLLARMEQRLHRYMHGMLGNSKAVLAELRKEGIPEEKLGLIYNGIDLAPFVEKATRKELLPAQNIKNDTLVFVIVANLIYYKGHMNLLRALGRVRGQLPKGWVLLCVGRDDGIGDELMMHAKENHIFPNVRWLGPRWDTAQLLMASDIGILCSDQEGFSNSILEGMAAGLPMVVTDVGGNTEAVIDGETGFVVPPQDPKCLAEAILKLVKDPALRQRMGEAGRRRIEERFSIDACARAYERFYTGLVEHKASSVQALTQGEAQ